MKDSRSSSNHDSELQNILGQRLPRRRLLLLAGSASAAALLRFPTDGLAQTQGTPAQSQRIRNVLPNGLVVLIDERRTADTIAMELTARDGSRDDSEHPGISVMTSRMMFQGTPRRPSETALQRAASAVGGSLSRGTSTEMSSFTSVVPSREADTAFDLVADVALNALLDEDALSRQKQIALQELAQRRASPNSYIDELFQTHIFAGHPAATPVLGTTETINALTTDAIAAWRRQMWTAPNLVLTITGRIRPDDALAAAQRYFGGLPSGAKNNPTSSVTIVEPAAREIRGTAGQQQVVFRVGFVAPSVLDPDRYPMTVLNSIMTGSSGRLFRELRSARGLAYVAGSGYTGLTDTGAWFATAGVDPQNVEAALEVVYEQIARMRDEAPTAEETARRQGEIAGRQILADETNSARASRLASQELLGTPPTEEYVRRIRAVTPADVQRVAQTYFDPDKALLVVVGPDLTSGATSE